MATTYNAGIVTAYGAAVRGGYTGTYDQYCEEQAHIGTNAQRAESAADSAEAAAQDATESAETLSGSVAQIATNKQDITALKEDLSDTQNEALSAFATDTASGSIATFSDGADNVPVKALTVAVEAVQSGSGDPSPDNIRPISGWDSVKVYRALINASMSTFTGDGYESGVYLTNTGATQESAKYAITAYIPVTPGKTVIIHPGTVSNPSFGWYDANKTYISGEKYNSRLTITLTVPEGVAYIRCSWNASTNYIEADVDVYDIDLPQTVYGGTLDVSTGVLTVDHALVDLGTLTWAMPDATNHIFRTTGLTDHKKTNGINYLCSAYLPVNSSVSASASMPDKSCMGNTIIGTYLYIRNTGYSDAASLKTSLSGVQLVYELDTPTTLTLTPTEVTTLLGQNNIYADSGEVSVTYRADTKLYIEKLTAPTEDDMIADHAISANSFFMIGNTLYRATTAIASGATITVGTNATKLSLSDALNALA